MPRFLDKLKEGAEKAGFEADRVRRLNQERSALRAVERELESQSALLGQQVLALYDANALIQSELLIACQQQIDPLRQQITLYEARIEEIRQEKPPETAAHATYGHICPRCQIQLPDAAGFCPNCGSPAIDFAPPPSVAGELCAHCQAPITPGALFCPSCGTPVKAAPAPETRCPSCHAPVPAEAIFCPNCGASTGPEVDEEAPTAQPADMPAQITCPICRASIPAEADFCPECGSTLSAGAEEPPTWDAWSEAPSPPGHITCPGCAATIPAEVTFCPECGTGIEPWTAESVAHDTATEEPDAEEELAEQGPDPLEEDEQPLT